MATRSIQLTVNSPYAVVSTRLWSFSTDDKIHIHTFIHSLQVFKTPEEDYEVIPILKSLLGNKTGSKGQGSLLVIITMIDGSEKRTCEGGF